jgi:hypothetical protein
MPGQSYIRELLGSGAVRDVPLSESGLEVRITRARPYRMIGARAIPLGTLTKELASATFKAMKGEAITDEEACAINEDAPSSVELCEALLVECVREMRHSEKPWVTVNIVEDGTPDEELGEDDYRVGDFQRSLPPTDLGELMQAVFEHNGLGVAIARLLAPFRSQSGRASARDGESIRAPANGDSET